MGDRTLEREVVAKALEEKLELFKKHFASLEFVGSGGQGRVYKVKERQTRDQYAAKVIPLDNWEEVEKLKQEAKVLKHLEHEGIPEFKEYYERENEWGSPEFILVTEFVKGKSLTQLMEEGKRFTEEELYDIGTQCKDILDYVHARGIVHRDIKPSNVMITDGKVKITDWGLTKLLGQRTRTKSATKGSIFYMSPEQINGGEITPKTDYFGLGLTLLATACGEERSDDVRYQKPEDDLSRLHHLGSDFKRSIERMLREEPGQREIDLSKDTCEEIIEELEENVEIVPVPIKKTTIEKYKIKTFGLASYCWLTAGGLFGVWGLGNLMRGKYALAGIQLAACGMHLFCAYLNRVEKEVPE